MAATRFDLVGPHAIEQGYPWAFRLTRLQPDRRPVDLTGYGAELVLFDPTDPAAAPLRYSSLSGHIVLGGAAGTVAVRLSAAETAALPTTHSRYRLVFTDPAGDADLYFRGRVAYLEDAG